MPMYLIFYRNRRGEARHCLMLCKAKKLRALLSQHKGVGSLDEYGRIIYKSYEREPGSMLKGLLRSRYGCDLDKMPRNVPFPV